MTNVIKLIKSFFKSDKELLQEQVMEQKTITVPVKKPAYHELYQNQRGKWEVRIYKRDGSYQEVIECSNIDEARKNALSMLAKFNGGV